MKTISIFIIGLLVLSSCVIKEESSTTDSFLVNNSGHAVELEYYLNGTIVSTESISLASSETRMVFSHSSRGKANGLSYGRKNSSCDSAIVRFDDTISMTHYSFKMDTTGKKGLGYIHPTNVFNENNYVRLIKNETKYSAFYEYKFTFTPEDYTMAKGK